MDLGQALCLRNQELSLNSIQVQKILQPTRGLKGKYGKYLNTPKQVRISTVYYVLFVYLYNNNFD